MVGWVADLFALAPELMEIVMSMEAVEVDNEGRGRLADAFVGELCNGGEGAAFRLGNSRLIVMVQAACSSRAVATNR